MPIFLDRHDLSGLTAADIANAHQKDLEVQDLYGVRFLTYWFDAGRGTAFCLIDAPDIATAMRVHDEAHGNVATDVIEVELSAVEAFLGRITDPRCSGTQGSDMDAAFRAVMFTDIVDSTGMTARLGEARAVEMVRAHDAIVRRALGDAGGREIKHTGDGIMACFSDVDSGVAAAVAIQRGVEGFNQASDEPLHLRIGIHAGEPVEDSNDLFGCTVQLAARICDAAGASQIVVSRVIHDTLRQPCALSPIGARRLKGFAEPVELFEVGWA